MFKFLLRTASFSLCLSGLIPSGSALAEQPVFSLGDKTYTDESFSDGLRQALYELRQEHYERLEHLAGAMLLELHLNEEAARQKTTREALEATLFAPETPTEEAMKAFYEQQKGMINQPYEAIKNQLKPFMMQRGIDLKRQAMIEKIKQEKSFQLAMAEPQAPTVDIRTEGFPFLGARDAKVELIVFADYQCPHCKQEMARLRPLMEKYGDRVKLVYRDFPINRSGISTTVAHGAECASQQGKFWEYNALAFELQSGLNADSPKDFAEVLELDGAAFEDCMKQDRTVERVAASKQEAEALQISSTPTLYVNGRLSRHDHENPDALEDAIKRLLNGKS